MLQSLPGALTQLSAKEVQLGTTLLSLLTSVLDLKARSEEVECSRDAEVELEEEAVHVETSPKDGSTRRVPDIVGLHVSVLAQMLRVVVHLLLRVNVLEHLGSVPPLLVGHDKHSLRLDLLDKLLSPLSQHGRGVGSAHQIHLLAIESLSKVNHSGFEAVDSVVVISTAKYLPIGLSVELIAICVLSANENMSWDHGCSLWAH